MPSGLSLVFVYNAESGRLPKLKDHIHTVTGETPGCNLYAITHSPIGMKKEWKRFVSDLGIPVRFLNRDEFSSEFDSRTTTFPVAFIQTGKDLMPLVSTSEINRCTLLADLIRLVQQRLSQFRT